MGGARGAIDGGRRKQIDTVEIRVGSTFNWTRSARGRALRHRARSVVTGDGVDEERECDRARSAHARHFNNFFTTKITKKQHEVHEAF